MNKNPYEVLGVSPNATDSEIKAAYRELARKYHPDNYSADDPLAHLAEEKMKEVNEAYDTIIRARNGSSSSSYDASSPFSYIRSLLGQNNFAAAESELDKIMPDARNAEWHFLKSICLDRRGRPNDAMTELDIACQMDPGNREYAQSRDIYRNRAGRYGNAYRTNAYGNAGQRSAANDVCNCCSNLIIADCCCECMGGDLCRCI